jgi:hypothetical protein
MTRLASKKKAQSAEQEGAGQGTAAEEVEKNITADNTVTEEHEPTANNAGEAESSDITLEEAGEEQGTEANTVQDDLQEVQASTNSTAGSSRTSRILEKKERKRELVKMRSDEIVGKMVMVQEEDGNEWLGKIITRDLKVKASNPYKYILEDKHGRVYRVDLLGENWKWHQVTEEVLLVMLPRSEHNTAESLEANSKELDLLAEFNAYEEIDGNMLMA